MFNLRKKLACSLLLFLVGNVYAETHSVEQKDKKFTTQEMTIKVGDVVRFTNSDDFFHNVYSLSDAKLFDLGSFPKGEFRDVTFDKAGKIEVECAIHPSMKMIIEVK